MKHLRIALLLAAVLLLVTSARADSPDAILKDYRKQSVRAVERLNQSLEKAATPLITKLVSSGDTDGAALLTAQLKDKLAGDLVPTPQASAASLFSMYDEACAKALLPVQKASIARIESLLHAAGGGKLENIAELGQVRAEIEGGAVKNSATSLSVLDRHKIPKVWGYYLSDKYDTRYGTLKLNDDGTLVIEAGNPVTGTWRTTSKVSIIAVDIKNASNVAEQTEIVMVSKSAATMKRLSGMKYLKAD